MLHANTEYPTPYEDVNLRSMISIGKKFNIKYGYSDHTLGYEVCIAAVSMGAKCLEKHFTLNRNMKGPDHKASLEPNELKEMIRAVRNIEKALGKKTKKPTQPAIRSVEIIKIIPTIYLVPNLDFDSSS